MSEGLHAALAKVQANLPAVAKGETAEVPTKAGGKYSYTYASLHDINEALLPVLANEALTWTCRVGIREDGMRILAGMLAHAPTGETLVTEWPLPAGDDPQRIGSAVTYARRYLLCALVGLAPDDDDDGRRAAQPPPVDTSEVEQALHDAKAAGVEAEHRDARKIMPYARQSQAHADKAAEVLRARIAEVGSGDAKEGGEADPASPDEPSSWEAAYGDLGIQPERLLIELQTIWPKYDGAARPTRTRDLDAAYVLRPDVFAQAIANLTPEPDDA